VYRAAASRPGHASLQTTRHGTLDAMDLRNLRPSGDPRGGEAAPCRRGAIQPPRHSYADLTASRRRGLLGPLVPHQTADRPAGDLRGDWRPLRGICGGRDQRKSANTGETANADPPCLWGFSPVFAGLRQTLRNRGARIRTGDLTTPNRTRYQAAPRPEGSDSTATPPAAGPSTPAAARAASCRSRAR
jgi:hypothetical protein